LEKTFSIRKILDDPYVREMRRTSNQNSLMRLAG
jgi:hypothetical protein